jgi:hypothetical protein
MGCGTYASQSFCRVVGVVVIASYSETVWPAAWDVTSLSCAEMQVQSALNITPSFNYEACSSQVRSMFMLGAW